MKLTTKERQVLAYLRLVKDKWVGSEIIAYRCDMEDYPYEQLLKMMFKKSLILQRYNISNDKYVYSLNPAYKENAEVLKNEPETNAI